MESIRSFSIWSSSALWVPAWCERRSGHMRANLVVPRSPSHASRRNRGLLKNIYSAQPNSIPVFSCKGAAMLKAINDAEITTATHVNPRDGSGVYLDNVSSMSIYRLSPALLHGACRLTTLPCLPAAVQIRSISSSSPQTPAGACSSGHTRFAVALLTAPSAHSRETGSTSAADTTATAATPSPSSATAAR